MPHLSARRCRRLATRRNESRPQTQKFVQARLGAHAATAPTPSPPTGKPVPVRLPKRPHLPQRPMPVARPSAVGIPFHRHALMHVALVHRLLLLHADDDAGVDEPPPRPAVQYSK